MKTYGIEEKALLGNKEVTIKKRIVNFSNGKVSYLLDNGKTVNASELSPKTVKKEIPKTEPTNSEEPKNEASKKGEDKKETKTGKNSKEADDKS